MGPESLATAAAEILGAAFLLLVGVNVAMICVPVTEDGPVETPDWDRPTVELAPVPEWEHPPAGHAPMLSGEDKRMWMLIDAWARDEEARQSGRRS